MQAFGRQTDGRTDVDSKVRSNEVIEAHKNSPEMRRLTRPKHIVHYNIEREEDIHIIQRGPVQGSLFPYAVFEPANVYNPIKLARATWAVWLAQSIAAALTDYTSQSINLFANCATDTVKTM